MALCGVCSAEASKYKCATCKAPSCSLPCFKTHAAQCTAALPQPNIEMEGSTAGIADAMGRESLRGPAYQPSSAELGELFNKYPTLRTQLQDIYKMTQRPEENNNFRGRVNARSRGRGSFAQNGAGDAHHRTVDKGFDRGLKQLQRGLEQENDHGEALRVFAAAISKTTMTKQAENDVDRLGP